MKPRYLVPTLLIGLTSATSVAAGAVPSAARRNERCFVPIANWQPRSAVVDLAKQNGWKVRRIKTDDGCYELKGWDKRGRAFEVLIDPQSLENVKIEYDKDKRDWLKKGVQEDN